ncbi:MAG TPA: acyl-homoserine-lactone synthase [Bauldia sp.]|nr:acyl-homoserine-lactone synthase [Bauldia sp.]
MLVVVEDMNAHEHKELLDEMFRLRARVFNDRLKWDVVVKDGMERDRYDDAGPVYLIYTDENRTKVKGSLRLLPTTGPTLLTDFFSDTLPDAAQLSAPSIWECTRFCLDEKILDHGGRDEVVFASGILFAGLGEIALQSGIESILGNFDATMYRLYRRIGCEVDILGITHRFGRPVYLGLFPVSWSILSRVKSRLRESDRREAHIPERRRLAA